MHDGFLFHIYNYIYYLNYFDYPSELNEFMHQLMYKLIVVLAIKVNHLLRKCVRAARKCSTEGESFRVSLEAGKEPRLIAAE